MRPGPKNKDYLSLSCAEEVKRLYLSGLAMQEIVARIGQSYLIVRRILLAYQVIRPMKDAQRTSRERGRFPDLTGTTRPALSEERKAKISRARTAWGEAHAKGSYLKNGYVVLTRGDKRGEHRAVAEAILGRKLLPTEVVHHIDRNRSNNDPSNLAVMSNSEHVRQHRLTMQTKQQFGRPITCEALTA
jgi:hypothetical protein